MNSGSLEERIARLEARQALIDLKSRYVQYADAKYTPAHRRVSAEKWLEVAHLQASCFTSDAEWHGGERFGGTLAGRAALAAWFTQSPWRFALHYYVAPALTMLEADSAEGSWRLWQVGVPIDADAPILLAGKTFETYRQVDGEWLIASMRFDEIHTVDLSNVPAVLRCVMPESDG